MNGDFPITYSAEPEGTATPHGNIDEIIMMAELENLMKNIERYGSIGPSTLVYGEPEGLSRTLLEAVDPVKGMGFLLGKNPGASKAVRYLSNIFNRIYKYKGKKWGPHRISTEEYPKFWKGEGKAFRDYKKPDISTDTAVSLYNEAVEAGAKKISPKEFAESPSLRTAWPLKQTQKEFASSSEKVDKLAHVMKEVKRDLNLGTDVYQTDILKKSKDFDENIEHLNLFLEYWDEITKRMRKFYPDIDTGELVEMWRGNVSESFKEVADIQLSLLDYIQGIGKN